MRGLSERYLGLDVLRSIAAFVVVLIHTPASLSSSYKTILVALLPNPNAIFAIMAGLFLAEKLRSQSVFSAWLKVRIKRLYAPYLFWVLVYLGLNIGFDLLRGNTLNCDFNSLKWWSGVIFCGHKSVQLWFIAMLFYSQILLFVLWRFVKTIHNKFGYAFLLFFFGFAFLNIYPHIPQELFLRNLVFMIGYLCFGCLINELDCFLVKRRKIVVWISSVLLVAFLLITLCHIRLPYNLGVLRNIGFVVLGRYIINLRVPAFVLSMGYHSMFIYLAHIVFTTLMPLMFNAVGIACTEGFSFLYVTFAAFILSWLSALFLAELKTMDFFRKHIAYWLGV